MILCVETMGGEEKSGQIKLGRANGSDTQTPAVEFLGLERK
jgi:hypothetical protein